MKTYLTILATAALLTGCAKQEAPQPLIATQQTADAQVSGNFDVIRYSPYFLQNNVWNAGAPGAGTQTCYINKLSDWGVTASHSRVFMRARQPALCASPFSSSLMRIFSPYQSTHAPEAYGLSADGGANTDLIMREIWHPHGDLVQRGVLLNKQGKNSESVPKQPDCSDKVPTHRGNIQK